MHHFFVTPQQISGDKIRIEGGDVNHMKNVLRMKLHEKAEMICCGDGYNDLTMIETAGLGVAMENAQPLVREKADFITKSNDDDGVLYVIDQFMRD